MSDKPRGIVEAGFAGIPKLPVTHSYNPRHCQITTPVLGD